jgi:uncharacterized protein (DUF488 family)
LKLIYTLGTDRRTEEEFAELLDAYQIRAVVDVRRFPTSKLEYFRQEALRQTLQGLGVAYYWMGPGLGGFRKGGYEAYSRTEEFQQAIGALEEIALREAPAVVLCAERFPWKCHRRWIARELQRRGWRIRHILEVGRVWEPPQP